MKKITRLKLFEKRDNIKKGCVMLYLEPLNFSWKNLINKIPENEVYYEDGNNFGIENTPHVTLLYGILEDQMDKNQFKEFKEFLNKIPKNQTFIANKIDIFENEEFDVLKINFNKNDFLNQGNNALYKINKEIENNFPYKNSYKDYSPHVTIAYLKKGSGKKYIQKITQNFVFKVDYLKYNSPSSKIIIHNSDE